MRAARIAIVDDDPLFVEYLSKLLTTRGYDVTAFHNGSDLLAALASASGPEVVLLDVLMPGMDGLETLRTIHSAHKGVPVIMLSGQQVPSTIVDAVRLGAIDYVVKPDDPSGLGEAALESAIRNAVEKLSLTNEVARLSAQASSEPDGGQTCWSSGSAMREVMTMIERVADAEVSVLISGESGVGKEVVARELHRRSSRRARPFVKVNCAALPADLLESELFGHERGAFTGAQATRVGKFEFADQGTIMLDEIAEMPAALQAKLLHVLQDREFTKLGSNRPVQVDVRIIAATNRDLQEMMQAGRFREDLYYRLQVIEIRVPPLRERREEIQSLVEFFLRRYSARYGRPVVRPSASLRTLLSNYSWPGNVRELENVVKRFVILQDENLVAADLSRPRPSEAAAPAAVTPAETVAAAPVAAAAVPAVTPTAADGASDADAFKLPELARAAAMTAERDAIQRALDRYHWNRRKAAQLLGVSYKTLLNKMKECGISTPPELRAE